MKLIDEWKHCWKWLSIQFPAVNVAFLSTWAMLPPKFQDAIPLSWVIGIAVAMIVLGMIGRLVDQQPKDKP